MDVGLESHYASVGERGFIEVIEAIDDAHDLMNVKRGLFIQVP